MRPNPQETIDLVTFTEEILNGKLHFLKSAHYIKAGKKGQSFQFELMCALTTTHYRY